MMNDEFYSSFRIHTSSLFLPGHTPFAAVKVKKSATAPRAGGCEFLRHSLFLGKFGHQKSHTILKFSGVTLTCSEIFGNAQFMLRTDASFGKGLRAILKIFHPQFLFNCCS
jgi:hypothetical protein